MFGFNTRRAAEVGVALADKAVPVARSGLATRRPEIHQQGKELQTFLAQVGREAGTLRLGFFSRAKLANSFKWRLLDSGIDRGVADELTGMVLMQLSGTPSATAPAQVGGHTPANAESNKIESLLAQASACGAQGAHAEAIDCYEQVLRIKLRHFVARNNLGVALLKLGRYEEAEAQFRQAIGVKPSYPDAHFNLGTLLRWRGDVAGSETSLRRALKLSPAHLEARVSLGLTLTMLGRLSDAKDCFEKVLRVAPRHAGALFGLGQIAGSEGRFDEAESSFKRALESNAKMPSAWAGLAGLRKMSSADSAWLKSAEDIVSSGLAPIEEADVRFAIGKYYDDTADFARAFKNYKSGNELLKSVAPTYDRAARSHFVDDMIRVYTSAVLSTAQPGASDSSRPVFVAGMMRSGTSLMEQIISSHPLAAGAGELSFWNDAVRKYDATVRKQLPDEALTKKLAEGYLRTLTTPYPDARKIVDKATLNSDYLGIIHSVFPNARMIYVQRDPIDTCLSCYFHQFSTAHNFTFDLADLAHYYREHHRLMAHWRTTLPPGTLLEVPYAELVADQEKWTRKVLDFIGLEWDAHCLSFHQTQRPVLTASFWQVRQKIYKSAVGRWHNYEKFIGPLRELQNLTP